MLDCTNGHQEEGHESEEVQTNFQKKITGEKTPSKKSSAQEADRREEEYGQFQGIGLDRQRTAAKGKSQERHPKGFAVRDGRRIALRRAIWRLAGIARH